MRMQRGAFVLMINDQSEVLLVRSLTNSHFVDHWSLPGGLVEPDETPEQAAVREVLEEVGITCKLEERLSNIKSQQTGIAASTFKARYVSGEIVLQAHEIAAAKWFTMAEASQLALAFNIGDLLRSLER